MCNEEDDEDYAGVQSDVSMSWDDMTSHIDLWLCLH